MYFDFKLVWSMIKVGVDKVGGKTEDKKEESVIILVEDVVCFNQNVSSGYREGKEYNLYLGGGFDRFDDMGKEE